ncbi:MAG: 1-acyl-sn-glycerol-3-phosphate acyltransferase [Nannocystis sp.]|nr:1-acyl-sn-glycerol-3-phosphate acyltransferase [Nannocystis sp.]
MVASTVSPLYQALRATLRAAVKVFYGDIEVTGGEHMPATGPTIIACNHPNSIVDPLLLGTVTQRQIAYCARDGLFRVPLFGRVLRSVGAIPIRRRSDHGGASTDNTDAFAACGAVLAEGGVLAIFPRARPTGTCGSSRSRPGRPASPSRPRPARPHGVGSACASCQWVSPTWCGTRFAATFTSPSARRSRSRRRSPRPATRPRRSAP